MWLCLGRRVPARGTAAHRGAVSACSPIPQYSTHMKHHGLRKIIFKSVGFSLGQIAHPLGWAICPRENPTLFQPWMPEQMHSALGL